jgi:hypothetical protein
VIVQDDFWNRIKNKKMRKIARPEMRKENELEDEPDNKKPDKEQREEGS